MVTDIARAAIAAGQQAHLRDERHPSTEGFAGRAVMDLPALRAFIAVAEERHFRRAAMRLCICQSPLSARILGLERQLGVRLFDRGPGAPVALTPAGEGLLPLAREIVGLAESAQDAMGRVRRGEVGKLNVAAVAGIRGRLLGNAVRRFRSAYPEVELTLCEMDVAQQLGELEDGRIDVAVIRHVQVFSRASATVLAEAELGIACMSDDPLAARETLDPRELADGRPILVPGTLAPACHEMTVEHCRTLGFEPTGRYGATGPELLLDALGAIFDRSAVALTPRVTCDNCGCRDSLAWRPLEGRPLILTTSALVDPLHDCAAAWNFVDALAEGALTAIA
jgi:DNA-binding transcriptional LysR family regulator